MSGDTSAPTERAARLEIDRLRSDVRKLVTALKAIAAQTDASWARGIAQAALSKHGA